MTELTRRDFLTNTARAGLMIAPVVRAPLGVANPGVANLGVANLGVATTAVLGSASSQAATKSSTFERPAYESPAFESTDTPRRLRLVNVHTHEKLSVVYRNENGYLQSSLDKINFVLRDYRANEVMHIDLDVLEYLFQIYTAVGSKKHIQILSGYRTPATNEMLRTRSSLSGVAKNSLHILGKAIDFKLPDVPTKKLQQTALNLRLGGIGYYRKSDFVHIDSGTFRSWG